MPDNPTRLRRSFIAIPLPLQLKKHLHDLQQRLTERLPEMRWSAVANLHLTLAFLGDQSEETLEQIAVSMLSVGRLSRRFRVRCRGLGTFPASHRARILWVGLEPVPALIELQKTLSVKLKGYGIPSEPHPFSPHLTLGRVRGRSRDLRETLKEAGDRDYGSIEISRMILYESLLHPEGARHLPRAKVQFGEHDIF